MLFVLPIVIYLLAYKTQQVFKSAWLFGLGYFGAGISWVHVSIADHGGVPLVGSIALMLLLCGYLALFPAVLFKLLSRYFTPSVWPLALPFGWLMMEWIRAWFLTGFPWLSIGYSQSNGILASFYPLVGEIGLSALILLVTTSAAVGIAQKRWLHAIVPTFVLGVSAMVLSNIQWTSPNGIVKTVALVQGNIAQSTRFDPQKDLLAMQLYKDMSTPYWNSDIIIWPEAAVSRLEPLVQDYLSELDTHATNTNTGLITGLINYEFSSDIAFNTLAALGIDSKGNNTPYALNHTKRYAKHHLLPIGEFVPFEALLRPLAPIFDLPMSSFSRGDYVQANLVAGNVHFAPAICFEIAFPAQIAANLRPETQALVTVSNDAWFGNSHGPHQHMQIAQVRAKEFGLPLLRATNNGVTAIVDHNGNVQSQLAQFEASVLSDSIQLVDGITPYRRFANWPIWLLALLGISIAIYLCRAQQWQK